MQATVATLLLLLQLRPVVGVLLCRVLSGAEGSRMEAGCPMPEARAAEPSPGGGPASERAGEKTNPALTAGESHECVFAELCTTTPPVIRLARAQIIGLPTQF